MKVKFAASSFVVYRSAQTIEIEVELEGVNSDGVWVNVGCAPSARYEPTAEAYDNNLFMVMWDLGDISPKTLSIPIKEGGKVEHLQVYFANPIPETLELGNSADVAILEDGMSADNLVPNQPNTTLYRALRFDADGMGKTVYLAGGGGGGTTLPPGTTQANILIWNPATQSYAPGNVASAFPPGQVPGMVWSWNGTAASWQPVPTVASQVTAVNGITLTQNPTTGKLDVGFAPGTSVGQVPIWNNTLKIYQPGTINQRKEPFTTTIVGNGTLTEFPITHGLNITGVPAVSMMNTSTGQFVNLQARKDSPNQITVTPSIVLGSGTSVTVTIRD